MLVAVMLTLLLKLKIKTWTTRAITPAGKEYKTADTLPINKLPRILLTKMVVIP